MPSLQEALLNGWWQGIVLALVVWALMRDQLRISAATRLAIWQVTMGIVVALPLLQFISLPEAPAKRVATAPAAVSAPAAVGQVAQIAPAAARPQRAVLMLEDDNFVEMVAVFGLLLAAFQILRLLVGYWALRRLKRKSVQCEVPLPRSLTRDARLLLSSRIGMPMAVGFRNPAILLPERMVRALSSDQIEQVVLHEAAHLERNDDWFALIERLVRAVFFIQPAIWFIGRQIERERELACDDWVVARSGQAKPYAEALARVAEIGTTGWTPILATGVGRRKEIFTRLEALFDQTRNKIPSASEPMVLAAALLLLFVVTQAVPFSRLFGFSSFDSRSVVSDNNTRREFSIKGDIEFTENEQDVAALAPGSMLLLSRDENWIARRIEIEADEDGKVMRRYFVSGIAQPYGSEAKRFLAKELPVWMKNQSRDLRARLARWVQAEGVEGALREVEGAMNGGIKREYLEELLKDSSLDTIQTRRWLRIAEQLDSDNDKGQLVDLAAQQAKSMGLEPALLELIQKLHSDEERARLMQRMVLEAEDAIIPKLLRVIGELHSDERKSNLLISAAREFKRDLPVVFFEVAKGIHSNEGRRRVMEAAMEHHGKDLLTQQQVVAHAGRLHSEDAKRSVVTSVLNQPELSVGTLAEVRKVAAQMHSTEDREAVLRQLNSR